MIPTDEHSREADLPLPVTPEEALAIYHLGLIDSIFLLMAKGWRAIPSDQDYEELTSDELDDPDFVNDFADAQLELWSRYSTTRIPSYFPHLPTRHLVD